jgi:hypothetical protein
MSFNLKYLFKLHIKCDFDEEDSRQEMTGAKTP